MNDHEELMIHRFCRKCGALMIAFDSLQEEDFSMTWFRCLTDGCHSITIDVNTCFHLDEPFNSFACSVRPYSQFLFPRLLN